MHVRINETWRKITTRDINDFMSLTMTPANNCSITNCQVGFNPFTCDRGKNFASLQQDVGWFIAARSG
jgi:hypothetical protein